MKWIHVKHLEFGLIFNGWHRIRLSNPCLYARWIIEDMIELQDTKPICIMPSYHLDLIYKSHLAFQCLWSHWTLHMIHFGEGNTYWPWQVTSAGDGLFMWVSLLVNLHAICENIWIISHILKVALSLLEQEIPSYYSFHQIFLQPSRWTFPFGTLTKSWE